MGLSRVFSSTTVLDCRLPLSPCCQNVIRDKTKGEETLFFFFQIKKNSPGQGHTLRLPLPGTLTRARPPARTGDPSPDPAPLTTRSAHGAPERPARGPLIGLTAQELPRHWPLSRSLGAAATRAPHGRGEAGSNRWREPPARPPSGAVSSAISSFLWKRTLLLHTLARS